MSNNIPPKTNDRTARAINTPIPSSMARSIASLQVAASVQAGLGSAGSESSCFVYLEVPEYSCYNKNVTGRAYIDAPACSLENIVVTYPDGSTHSGVGSVDIDYKPKIAEYFTKVSFTAQSSCAPAPNTKSVLLTKQAITQNPLVFAEKSISADGQTLKVIMERVEMNAVIEPKDDFDLTKYLISQTKEWDQHYEDGQHQHHGPDADIPSSGDDPKDFNASEPFYDIAGDGQTGPKKIIIGQSSPNRITSYELKLITTLEGPLGKSIIHWGYKFTVNYTTVPPLLSAEAVGPTFTNPCD